MASMALVQFSALPRKWTGYVNQNPFLCENFWKIQLPRVNIRVLKAVSATDSLTPEDPDAGMGNMEKKTRTSKRAPSKSRKQAMNGLVEDSALNSVVTDKAPESQGIPEEEAAPKKTRPRRRKKNPDDADSQVNRTEASDNEGEFFAFALDEDNELDVALEIDEGEDISFTYGWPPLVLCFGAAQLLFVQNGRPANRRIDYEIHDRNRRALWEPEKFVRSSGGCASNVAISLAKLGGKVAFMGKLGDDDFGQYLLYLLNSSNVQTRSIRLDSKGATALSKMKVIRRAGLRMSSVKPCAQDCLSISEINVDVLKEAKMFYFNSFSLLDQGMRSTTFQAIRIAKKLGSVIFYDPNLPLPLWKSTEETKMVVQKAWRLSNIIEITKQELEFLCGIKPSETFDTKDNDSSKFTHYPPEVISQLWHDDLKVLFVTNGTSKVHYYTKEFDGFVYGSEDSLLTPYTAHMSASGDGMVAGILRMLTVQPHLITDRGYLEKTIRFAITCGVTDQWLEAQSLGYPAKEEMDVEADFNGIRSVTEREYRTIVPSQS